MGDKWERLILLLIRIALIPQPTDIVNEGDKFCTLRPKRQTTIKKKYTYLGKIYYKQKYPHLSTKKSVSGQILRLMMTVTRNVCGQHAYML